MAKFLPKSIATIQIESPILRLKHGFSVQNRNGDNGERIGALFYIFIQIIVLNCSDFLNVILLHEKNIAANVTFCMVQDYGSSGVTFTTIFSTCEQNSYLFEGIGLRGIMSRVVCRRDITRIQHQAIFGHTMHARRNDGSSITRVGISAAKCIDNWEESSVLGNICAALIFVFHLQAERRPSIYALRQRLSHVARRRIDIH